MKKRLKRVAQVLGILALVGLVGIFACNAIISHNARGKLSAEVESVAPMEYGLLLGTTPQTRIGRKQNQFFTYRIRAAEQLYKADKIRKILISGDACSLDGVNEVECMRDSFVARGVAAQDIILDGKGYRTLDSVWRAVEVYGIRSFVVISQKFHNERAIYLAEHLPINAQTITGFNAADASNNTAIITYLREYLARVKVFVDLIGGKKPIEED